ncbi:response regulator [Mucilaginibacter sp. HD30]
MGIRILLADDHCVVRDGIRQILKQEPDFVIAGEGENGREIIDLLESGTEADVLLADLSMPIMDGIQLAEAVGVNYPNLKVVLLTFQEDEAFVQRAFQAGIKSYLFKTSDPHEMAFAVRQVASGNTYLCSNLANNLIKQITAWSRKSPVEATNIEFSERELDVLRLIADGFTNEEAADKLFTSRRTVEGHRQSMIDKTSSRNSLALVRFAVEHGLLK